MSKSFEESEAQYRTRIENERAQLDLRMTDPATSPLSRAQIDAFRGVSHFPIDMKYRIAARLTRSGELSTQLTMTDGSRQGFVKYGTASFSVDGNNIVLEIFKNKNLPELNDRPDQLFVPFTDGTTGTTTSETGRYIAVDEPASGDLIELDFNRASNTYNGFNRTHSSVMAPAANNPKVHFSVGQRKFEDR